MTSQPRGTQGLGPSAESTLLTLAVLFFVVVILSAVTLIPRGGSADTDLAATGESLGAGDGEFVEIVDEAAAAGGQAGGAEAGGSVRRSGGSKAASGAKKSAGGTAGAAGATGGAAGGTSGGGATGGGAGGTGSGTVAGPAGGTEGIDGGGATGGEAGYEAVNCEGGKGGATDTGVSGDKILLGAVTVESGPGATFLAPESIAIQAVAAKVNAKGGICGREIELKLHDSGWNAQNGLKLIRNLIEGEKVFALVVNPDSEGLDAAVKAGYISDQRVPVIGTDGLLYSQYQEPYIWPIAASTVTAMHAIALSQYSNGARNFSIVYETTYRFGREGAKAYNTMVKAKTGADIPGYTDPDVETGCAKRFCGVAVGDAYQTKANIINTHCGGDCDAGAVLLEPATAAEWFNNGGRFGGVQVSRAGSGAAPQPLFDTQFATQCQTACDHLRVWTGFLPPLAHFRSQPGVERYVNDLEDFSPNADEVNQFAEGAYLGMRLAMDAIGHASVRPDGLTRENVVAVLDSTSGYDIGLTVRPLSWSKGDHFALKTVHAFDEDYATNFGGWQYVQGSVTDDPDPRTI